MSSKANEVQDLHAYIILVREGMLALLWYAASVELGRLHVLTSRRTKRRTIPLFID